jgi:oligopeptide/dipeptide ABC transporter ATP-binding protein
MSVAAKLCDRIAVMYAGQIAEMGTAVEILTRPKHPYSQGLVRTSAEIMRRVDRLQEIPGELPNWRSLPEGCRFRPRCAFARQGCEREQSLRLTSDGREVRCLLYEDVR